MTKEPVACNVDTGLVEAARLMREKNVGCLVALQADRVAGILTDRDVVLCLASKGAECTVGDAMTRNIASVRADDSILHLVDTFRSAGVVRRLPVIDDRDRLIGIVSLSDVAVVAEDLMKALFLEDTKNADAPHLLTGAKELVKRMRRPSRADDLPRRQAHAVTAATESSPKSGRGSA